MGFLRSRVTMGIIGFIVFGVFGALAVTTPLHFGTNTTPITQGISPTATATSQPSQSQATATPVISPTDATTPTDTPTQRVSPTRTPTPPGSPNILRGTIAALGNNSFTLNESTGGSITVVVNGNTQYQNVSGFSSLRTGMFATVTGTLLPGGNFQATIVHIHSGD
jgi:hypothetical protein